MNRLFRFYAHYTFNITLILNKRIIIIIYLLFVVKYLSIICAFQAPHRNEVMANMENSTI